MLSKADDYPFHQSADPVAFAGTDRNFYDRFFFNGMSRDGKVFFAVAFGLYPQLDIMDAAVSVLVEGRQHVLRASKHMGGERAVLSVGPISIEILEPLEQLRITVAENEGSFSGQMTFHARHAPIEEPRFTMRRGTRALFDFTRMTQNGTWSGALTVDGRAIEVSRSQFSGTRDRSWGVRPVGAEDSQPPAGGAMSQFFWLWAPTNFENHAVFLHTTEDAEGTPWNRRAVICPVGGAPIEFENIELGYEWRSGTRRLDGVTCKLSSPEAEATLRYRIARPFFMSGIGYFHPSWGHGRDQGELKTAHEIIDASQDPSTDPLRVHIQGFSAVELEFDGETHRGFGVVEQLFLGPHAPTGMKGALGPVER